MTATMNRAGSTICKPRFFTPRDEKFPTHGASVAAIAQRLGRPLMPWQRELVDVAFEYDAETGRFRYREINITVPRQSGKTTLVLAKNVHRLTVMAKALGEPQRATYTAQKRQKARNKLEKDFAQLLRRSPAFREITNAKARPKRPTEWHLSLNNGSESIQIGVGNYLQIDVPSRDGGHGDTLDVGDIDEAFAHRDDTVEGGMRPTMLTRANAQLWVLSTAGDATSFYLWRKILAGRAAHESGEHGNVCYVEYSAEDDADPGDPATWWSCMPALGHTIEEDTVRDEWVTAQRTGTEGIDGFRRTMLNQWPEVPVLEEEAAEAKVPYEVWLRLADPDAKPTARVAFGVDIGTDRLAHIAVAWRRRDGAVQVQLADQNVGPLRTPGRLRELSIKWKGDVALGGTSAALENEVRRSYLVSGVDFAAACGRFEDMFRDARENLLDPKAPLGIRHGNQPELNQAVRDADWRPFGQSGASSLVLRDNPTVGPLAAVIRALHAIELRGGLPPAPPKLAATAAATGARRSAPRSETADLSTIEF